jgi:uncharacterized protein (TIGR03382 family)
MRAPLLVAAVVALAASDAAAHTRPAAVLGLALDANDADHLVIQMTSGLGISEDGGVSWSWICSDAVGFDNGFEDPPILVDGSGAIVFAGFDGLGRSSVDACDWSFEASALADQFVIDLAPEAGDPDRFLALRTSGSEPDRIYRSTDGGRSVVAVGGGLGELLTERVQVAASDPSRVYLSGFIPAEEGADRRLVLRRSSDGGESFTELALPALEGERSAEALAVDPTDPDRLLVRMVRLPVDERDERVILSEDGGETWATALETRAAAHAVFSEDGTRAWVGSRDFRGLFRSDDAGRTFTSLVDPLSVTCLHVRGDELWVCADEVRDPFSVAVSVDGGATLTPRLTLIQLQTLPSSCACDSDVGQTCPPFITDLANDIGFEPGDPLCGGAADGGVGGPGGGGCTVAGPTGAWLPLLLLVLVGLRRRHRAG